MIISKTPLRIGFAGGGSDLPSFYREEEGAVLTTAFNKYIYITVKPRIDKMFKLNYSKTEVCEKVDDIEHAILKNVLKKYYPQGGIEITAMSDVPSGTGLGSSSSFTVGLLNALKKYLGQDISPAELAPQLAKEACDIEITELKEPIGKQDQFIAAYGGLQFLRFMPSGEVKLETVNCKPDTAKKLASHTLLFYTGMRRDAKDVFSELKASMGVKKEILREMVGHAREMKNILESSGDLKKMGELIHECWLLKKNLASRITTPEINEWYDAAMKAGAWGGKILGAGRGGFLMFICEPEKQEKVKKVLSRLEPHGILLEHSGSQIILSH